MTIPKTLKNFNLYLSKKDTTETSCAGVITELTLPKLTIKTEDFRAGGMDTSIPIDLGMEPLSCDFTLAEYQRNILKLFGSFDFETNLTLRGAFNDGMQTTGMIIKLSGLLKEVDFGPWKCGTITNQKASFMASYYQLTMDDEVIIEIDAFNLVRKVNGVDQLQKCRGIIFGG